MRVGLALRERCPTCQQPLPDDEGTDLTFGPLVVSPISHRVTVDGAEITLTDCHFQLLVLLAVSSPDFVTWGDMAEHVLGQGPTLRGRHNARVNLSRLRTALGKAAAARIKTTPGSPTTGGVRLT